MTAAFPSLRRAAALVTAAVAVSATAMAPPAVAASGTEGPAPAPQEFRVLADVHTDAVSTFLDDDVLTLGTRADVPEGQGARFAADEVWFHVDDDSATTVPAGYEFVAPAGSSVWLAPEANPGGDQLWPGFSTESVPAGAIDDDRTTFTLSAAEGPGDVELFTTGPLGSPERLWSSDEDITSFETGRTHMHANWAFTQAGTYRLTVEAAALRAGEPVTATATYTFVVGDLPETVATESTVSSSADRIHLGESVELTGTVTPASAGGYLEFRAGTTVLGHERVVDGTATFTTGALGLGSHAVTANFVPEVANLAAPSTSAPVTVDVTEPGGEPFRVEGVAASYQPGDELVADAVGLTPGEGQTFRWVIRVAGSTSSGYVAGTGPQLVRPLTAADDGYEIKVQLRTGSTLDAETAWVPIAVEPIGSVPVLTRADERPLYAGDPFELALSGRELAEGETFELVKRWNSPWYPVVDAETTVDFPEPDRVVVTTGLAVDADYAVQVVRDGIAVAQSAPVPIETLAREVMFEGLQPLYRDGATLRVTASVHPELAGATYSWQMPYGTVLEEGTGPEAMSFEKTMTMADDNQRLYFVITKGHLVISRSALLRVTDAPPEEQVLLFNTLSDHYHQGNTINLALIADPPPSAGDTIAWEWRWPGLEWTALPGATGLTHPIVAEQALDGVEVRATLTFGNGSAAPVTAPPVTIHVDDHGAPPRQTVTVSGETSYPVGHDATLTAGVQPGTVLSTYQWFRKTPGDAEAVPIPGATGSTYTFTTTADHDGNEFSVAVVTPDGQLAYGPSAPVVLAVA